MAITEYEDQIQEIVSKPDHSEFIYDFLGVYDIPRATVTKLRKGMNNLAKEAGAVYLKNKLYFREGTGDVRAAERFAKLYDVVKHDNPNATPKGLNLFLIRILFCLFAEDTNIFEHDLFTNRVKQMTVDDGSNFDQFIGSLFGVLDFEKTQRPVDTPSWLNDFPYVDGDLFKDQHESLHFSAKSRKLIIEAGELLKWDQINPDILGSMIQAVASEDSRSHLGMHYTSVPNIMKVIKPLFLDGLREDFEAAKGNENKLQQLYDRIGKIKFMDPACGSGNFLIITYKELRQLEIDIIKELNRIPNVQVYYLPSVTLDQFYGIEIDDFACDVTRLSLWIAEHQMNVKLHEQISDAVRATLPLQHAGAILCGNALTINWNNVMIHDAREEVYLFGNPPYLGYSLETEEQSSDMNRLFENVKGSGFLDYVSGWFLLGSRYIQDSRARCAFVATNSIVQGIQVAPLWKTILETSKIVFAYSPFKWSNNAKANAGVTVVIIGLSDIASTQPPTLYNQFGSEKVPHITPYLTSASRDIVVTSSTKSLFGLPDMTFGSKAVDGGGLILTSDEYQDAVEKYPELFPYIKKYIGADEFIKNKTRYVLWISEDNFNYVKSNDFVEKRLKIVKRKRLASKKKQTRELAATPYKFAEIRYENRPAIIVPGVSSESRSYIPMGFVDKDTVVSNSANTIYDPPVWLLGLLESRMHMVWVKNIGGSLETRYRYAVDLLYSTYPVPTLSTRRKNQIEELVYQILDIREEEGGTLAKLYGSPLATKNPKDMNKRLLAAHQQLDEVVDRAYKPDGFLDDSQRLTQLLQMYDERVNTSAE